MRDYYLQRLIFKATLRVFWGCFFFSFLHLKMWVGQPFLFFLNLFVLTIHALETGRMAPQTLTQRPQLAWNNMI